jgi:peptidyl-prolyl cis-trans isomerase D
MFEFFRTHTKFLLGLLILLIIPSFVFFGLEGYTRMREGGNTAVARIGSEKITQTEWDVAHRNQVERVRRQMPNVEPAMLDTPEMKRLTLENAVRERVLLRAADELHLVTTDERLKRLFVTDPQFAFLRNPDGTVNRELLSAQGMSSEMFAQRLRGDLSMRQVMAGVGDTAFATDANAGKAFDALLQQREVRVQRFAARDYVGKVNPTPADVEAYYQDPVNAERFRAPEQADVEYVVLDMAAIEKSITLPEEELRKYYTENAARFTVPEERRASHILVKADASMSADDRSKARQRADEILARVKANPASFADEARRNSQDPGSAQNGGDLDFFSRGAMVKPFEDAAFALKPGEISGVVESDFGFHVIRLTERRGGEKKSFEAARAEIETEVRGTLAQRRFAEAAVDFGNLVYEQADSLKPAADRFKLETRIANGVTRVPVPGMTGPLANAKLLEQLFSSDSVRTKRNTESVEIGSNQLAAARLVRHQPARTLPLDEVRDAVRQSVVSLQAAKLAQQEGLARLEAVRKAPEPGLTAPATVVSRAAPGDLPRDAVQAILKEPAATLPAFLGVDLGRDGYLVAQITKVIPRDATLATPQQVRQQYAQAWGNAESAAYYEALKTRFKVKFETIATPPAPTAR